ncbi:MAG: hypothetical protein U1E57_09465 [Paenacidovorax caeni]
MFYITARHCLTDKDANIAALAARLHVPAHSLSINRVYGRLCQFEDALSLKHESDDIPGRFIDVMVLTSVHSKPTQLLYNMLLERCTIKLPHDSQLADRFAQHPVAKVDFDIGRASATVMGYPHNGTASRIEYPDGKPVEIVTQAAKFSGFLGKGTGPIFLSSTTLTGPTT